MTFPPAFRIRVWMLCLLLFFYFSGFFAGFYAYRSALAPATGEAVWTQFFQRPGGLLQWGLGPLGAFALLAVSGFCWAGLWCAPLAAALRGGFIGALLAFLPWKLTVFIFIIPIEALCLAPLLLQAGNTLTASWTTLRRRFLPRPYVQRTALNALLLCVAQALCLGWAKLLL